MGILSWLFGGGNAGLIAKSIAKHHRTMESFDAVTGIYLLDFGNRSPGSRNYDKAIKAVEMIVNEEIKNYRDLAILALYVDAAPQSYNFYDVQGMFAEDVSKYLSQHGIDSRHISGNMLET
jgi:hypothetical protein